MIEEYKAVLWRPLTIYEEQAGIDFIKRDARFESDVAATSKKVATVVDGIHNNIINQVKRHKILKNGSYGAIRKVTVNTKPVQPLLLNAYAHVYLTGKLHAKQEVQSSLKKPIKFADIADVKPTESLDQFSKRVPITKAEFNRLIARERAKVFTVAGVMEKDIIGNVQTLLTQAIDEGWSLQEFRHAIVKADVKYTGTVFGTAAKQGEPLAPFHVETILRTNFSDVYNRGRNALFNEPAVIPFVPAFQYSAILDTRTRETHAAMDGRIYPRDDPIWSTWNPPNGFNCRCIKTAITINQEYVVSRPTTLKPDKGFGGAGNV